jgi:hypothetical protein
MLNLEIVESAEPKKNNIPFNEYSKSVSKIEISILLPPKEISSSKPFCLIGIVVLGLSIIGGSAIPPFMNLYGDVSTFTKNLWKCQLNFIISIPLVILSMRSQSEHCDWEFIKSAKGNAIMMLNGAVFVGVASTFIASSWLTITSHALILGWLAGVFLIIYKMLMWQPTHFLEKLGTVVVIIGSVLLINDKNVEKIGGQEVSVLGDVLAIIWSLIYAVYLPLSKYIIKKVPVLYIYMYTSISACLWFFLIIVIFSDVKLSVLFSTHPKYGIFGWLSDEQWKISIFLIAPIWGFMANALDVLSLRYFESHIIGNSHMLEPFLGQLIGYLIGQEKLPGILTYLGAFTIIWGIYKIAEGSVRANEKMPSTDNSEWMDSKELLQV